MAQETKKPLVSQGFDDICRLMTAFGISLEVGEEGLVTTNEFIGQKYPGDSVGQIVGQINLPVADPDLAIVVQEWVQISNATQQMILRLIELDKHNRQPALTNATDTRSETSTRQLSRKTSNARQ
jgi:hypothetical protein